ncbi:hypothetical protein [Vibrio vulnificus]|uniref:hypothetical protein n=1 Tax=Vibrio vulnificus TaxID=672 RepID=UPI001EEA5C0C|nr:hypothetical protein [Vibrio vulnificus]EJU9865825.1 hypothetical protein [Vibrio vulnificus]MCG6290232.1 hypothetical protein [Vibrio vulnificus]
MKCVHDGIISDTPPNECQGVVFLEPHDTLGYQLTEFDSELFGLVLGALLASFLIGHFAGRTVRWLGKL